MEKIINNKEEIIKCSIKLFSTRGYDAVGIQEIVDASKVTKPTMYHYFGSKRGLLDAIVKEYGDRFYNEIKEQVEYKGDITNNLNLLAFGFVYFAKNNEDFYRMQLAMYFSPPESEANQAVNLMNLRIYEKVENLFELASRDHGNMKGRQKSYAATFIGMINTYIALSLNGYAELDNNLIYKAVHQFMHGIFS
jgi:AcrR family transcriptional regulator